MDPLITGIYQTIEKLNPVHAKKLKKSFASFDDRYAEFAEPFLNKYISYLQKENKTIDYAVDCYLNMIADMNFETVEFARTGKYSSSTFEEVNKRVYANPATMEYYMHGLLMSQFLWKHHYEIFNYFINALPAYRDKVNNYLEIGAGHGLYLSKALEVFKPGTSFTVVDISQTSIDLATNFNNDDRVSFFVKDIFDFSDEATYDFICMGEVLEHVEEPLKLLTKLRNLLTDDGTLFITTPTNAPAIDHIYLFNNIEEIQELLHTAGFEITSEVFYSSEDVSPERAAKFKIALLYGAFLKKKK